MVCQNPKCGGELKSGKKFCSTACFLGMNRGHSEPLHVDGSRWVELGGHRWALVDERFYAELTNGIFWSKSRCRGGRLYAHRYVAGREVKLHHWVMRRVLNGPIPEGFLVDHINGDGLDNRAANLRLATKTEQGINRRSISHKTGFRGVYETPSGSFAATLRVAGRRKVVRTAETAEEAAKAYDAAARMSYRSFARLNYPVQGEQSAIPLYVQLDETLMTG